MGCCNSNIIENENINNNKNNIIINPIEDLNSEFDSNTDNDNTNNININNSNSKINKKNLKSQIINVDLEEIVNEKKEEIRIKKFNEEYERNLLEQLKKDNEKKEEELKLKKLYELNNYNEFKKNFPIMIKIIFLGVSKSGKTSIINRIAYDNFSNNYITTLNIGIVYAPNYIIENKIYHIELIDTPPLEIIIDEKDNIVYQYIKQSNLILFIYDLSKNNSLNELIDLISKIQFYNNQIIGILGNKKDIAPEYKKYRYFEIENYCLEFGFDFELISVKNSKKNIDNFLTKMFPKIHKDNKIINIKQ